MEIPQFIIIIIPLLSEYSFMIPWIITILLLIIINRYYNNKKQRMVKALISSFFIIISLLLSRVPLPPYSFYETIVLYTWLVISNILIVVISLLKYIERRKKQSKVTINSLNKEIHSNITGTILISLVNTVFILELSLADLNNNKNVLESFSAFFMSYVILFLLFRFLENKKTTPSYYNILIKTSVISVLILFILTRIIYSDYLVKHSSSIFMWMINSSISCVDVENHSQIIFYNPFYIHPCKITIDYDNDTLYSIIPPRTYRIISIDNSDNSFREKIKVTCYTGEYSVDC